MPFLQVQGILNPQPAGLVSPTGVAVEMKTAPCLREKCALWIPTRPEGTLYAPGDDDGNCAIRLLGFAAGRLPLSLANNSLTSADLPSFNSGALEDIARALKIITTDGLKVQRKE
jgi:hypothetical protein